MATQDARAVQKIHDNINLFTSLVKKIKDEDVRNALTDLCEEVGSRLAACPASTNVKYIGAFPGGLVWHSIEVLKVMKELNKIYGAEISADSLILCALFHDIGKIGNKNEDYYEAQTSDWHAKKGMLFTINENLANISVSVRSLWWLSTGVPLSEAEIHAITSLQHMGNMYSSELYNAPMLTLILQQAVRAVCVMNKGHENVLSK